MRASWSGTPGGGIRRGRSSTGTARSSGRTAARSATPSASGGGCVSRWGRRSTSAGRTWRYADTLIAEDLNWIAIPRLDGPRRVKAKTRYRQTEQWATVRPEGPDRIRLTFDAPQRAMTVGQALVLYDGDVVVGGGTIAQVLAGSEVRV